MGINKKTGTPSVPVSEPTLADLGITTVGDVNCQPTPLREAAVDFIMSLLVVLFYSLLLVGGGIGVLCLVGIRSAIEDVYREVNAINLGVKNLRQDLKDRQYQVNRISNHLLGSR